MFSVHLTKGTCVHVLVPRAVRLAWIVYSFSVARCISFCSFKENFVFSVSLRTFEKEKKKDRKFCTLKCKELGNKIMATQAITIMLKLYVLGSKGDEKRNKEFKR